MDKYDSPGTDDNVFNEFNDSAAEVSAICSPAGDNVVHSAHFDGDNIVHSVHFKADNVVHSIHLESDQIVNTEADIAVYAEPDIVVYSEPNIVVYPEIDEPGKTEYQESATCSSRTRRREGQAPRPPTVYSHECVCKKNEATARERQVGTP